MKVWVNRKSLLQSPRNKTVKKMDITYGENCEILFEKNNNVMEYYGDNQSKILILSKIMYKFNKF